MKALVKETGEIVDVRPEKNGYFIDDANSNAYKFEELDFNVEEKPENNPYTSVLNSFISYNSMTEKLDERFQKEFYFSKHIEIVFKFMEVLKDEFHEFNRWLSASIAYSCTIMDELKKYQAGKSPYSGQNN